MCVFYTYGGIDPYMDDNVLLPSKETIRRFQERATMLYEQPNIQVHRQYIDSSDYPANEVAPTNHIFEMIIKALLEKVSRKQQVAGRIWQYVQRWSRWLKIGMSDLFTRAVDNLLPALSICWQKTTTPIF